MFQTPQNTDANDVTGSIPTEIGSLASLTYLDFGKLHETPSLIIK